MSLKIKYRFLLTTALSFAFLNAVEVKQIAPQHSQLLTFEREAYAKKVTVYSRGNPEF